MRLNTGLIKLTILISCVFLSCIHSQFLRTEKKDYEYLQKATKALITSQNDKKKRYAVLTNFCKEAVPEGQAADSEAWF